MTIERVPESVAIPVDDHRYRIAVAVNQLIAASEAGGSGAPGPQGPAGPAGPEGPPGLQGVQGVAGPQGDVGPQGPAGPQGDIGPPGADGEDGAQGLQGIQGPAGADGAPGVQGIQGPAGADGAPGADGAAGQGVPVGGTTGQVLAKTSATDYATAWTTPSAGTEWQTRTLAADQSMTNDTTMRDWFASAGGLPLLANSTYEFEGLLSSINGTTSHGLNMQFAAIAGATIRWTAIGSKVNETTQATAFRHVSTNTFATSRNVTTGSAVGGNVVRVKGVVITTTAGTLRPQVAQSAASGSFTMKQGTYFKARRLGADTFVNSGEWA